MEQRRHERIMGKFKDAIVAKLAASSPSRPITHELHLHLQERLPDLILSSKIPSHPPYAWMIRMAIMDLNEEGGSTDEAISSSIRKENDDLPYAHSSFLSHYLGILVSNAELCLNGGKYCIPPSMVHGSEDEEVKNVCRFKPRWRSCNMRLWRKQKKNKKVNSQKRERLERFMCFKKQNMSSVVKGEERTGLVQYGIKAKEIKSKRSLVCGVAANSTTRQQSEPKRVDGMKNTSKLQAPASSYLSKSQPKNATPERSAQNQERPLKVYYRRKLRVASINSSGQNQQKAGKIYHEENVMSCIPAEGKENYRSATVITGLEHEQQLRWAMQKQRTKGIRVARCRIADKDRT